MKRGLPAAGVRMKRALEDEQRAAHALGDENDAYPRAGSCDNEFTPPAATTHTRAAHHPRTHVQGVVIARGRGGGDASHTARCVMQAFRAAAISASLACAVRGGGSAAPDDAAWDATSPIAALCRATAARSLLLFCCGHVTCPAPRAHEPCACDQSRSSSPGAAATSASCEVLTAHVRHAADDTLLSLALLHAHTRQPPLRALVDVRKQMDAARVPLDDAQLTAAVERGMALVSAMRACAHTPPCALPPPTPAADASEHSTHPGAHDGWRAHGFHLERGIERGRTFSTSADAQKAGASTPTSRHSAALARADEVLRSARTALASLLPFASPASRDTLGKLYNRSDVPEEDAEDDAPPASAHPRQREAATHGAPAAGQVDRYLGDDTVRYPDDRAAVSWHERLPSSLDAAEAKDAQQKDAAAGHFTTASERQAPQSELVSTHSTSMLEPTNRMLPSLALLDALDASSHSTVATPPPPPPPPPRTVSLCATTQAQPVYVQSAPPVHERVSLPHIESAAQAERDVILQRVLAERKLLLIRTPPRSTQSQTESAAEPAWSSRPSRLHVTDPGGGGMHFADVGASNSQEVRYAAATREHTDDKAMHNEYDELRHSEGGFHDATLNDGEKGNGDRGHASHAPLAWGREHDHGMASQADNGVLEPSMSAGIPRNAHTHALHSEEYDAYDIYTRTWIDRHDYEGAARAEAEPELPSVSEMDITRWGNAVDEGMEWQSLAPSVHENSSATWHRVPTTPLIPFQSTAARAVVQHDGSEESDGVQRVAHSNFETPNRNEKLPTVSEPSPVRTPMDFDAILLGGLASPAPQRLVETPSCFPSPRVASPAAPALNTSEAHNRSTGMATIHPPRVDADTPSLAPAVQRAATSLQSSHDVDAARARALERLRAHRAKTSARKEGTVRGSAQRERNPTSNTPNRAATTVQALLPIVSAAFHEPHESRSHPDASHATVDASSLLPQTLVRDADVFPAGAEARPSAPSRTDFDDLVELFTSAAPASVTNTEPGRVSDADTLRRSASRQQLATDAHAGRRASHVSVATSVQRRVSIASPPKQDAEHARAAQAAAQQRVAAHKARAEAMAQEEAKAQAEREAARWSQRDARIAQFMSKQAARDTLSRSIINGSMMLNASSMSHASKSLPIAAVVQGGAVRAAPAIAPPTRAASGTNQQRSRRASTPRSNMVDADQYLMELSMLVGCTAEDGDSRPNASAATATPPAAVAHPPAAGTWRVERQGSDSHSHVSIVSGATQVASSRQPSQRAFMRGGMQQWLTSDVSVPSEAARTPTGAGSSSDAASSLVSGHGVDTGAPFTPVLASLHDDLTPAGGPGAEEEAQLPAIAPSQSGQFSAYLLQRATSLQSDTLPSACNSSQPVGNDASAEHSAVESTAVDASVPPEEAMRRTTTHNLLPAFDAELDAASTLPEVEPFPVVSHARDVHSPLPLDADLISRLFS